MKLVGIDKVCTLLRALVASFLVLSIASSQLFRVGDVVTLFV